MTQVITRSGLVEVVTRSVLGHEAVDLLRPNTLALVVCLTCGITWEEGGVGLAECRGAPKR